MTAFVVTGVTPDLTHEGAPIIHHSVWPTEAAAAAELARLRAAGCIHPHQSTIYAADDLEETA